MATWWGKDEDKVDPKLKGKSQEDILKMMDDANASKERVAALEAERIAEREQVTRMGSEFASIKGKLDSIEANRGAPLKKEETEEHANFVEDPDAAFNGRAKPLAQLAANTAAITAKMLAQQHLDNEDMVKDTKNGRLFRAWDGEIMQVAQNTNILALGNAATWVEIYYRVKGIHSDELGNPETRKKNYSFLEPSSHQQVNNVDNSTKPAADQLTDQEKIVAGKMGITPEKYLERKKGMQFVA